MSATKWIALSNVTLGVLLANLDGSIVRVAMPDIFRGIHLRPLHPEKQLSPLRPENSIYLFWMILGYLLVTSVRVVGFGRLGDLFGRVRLYTVGFAIYMIASVLLTVDWMDGRAGADWLIGFRLVQGVGRVPGRELLSDLDRRVSFASAWSRAWRHTSSV